MSIFGTGVVAGVAQTAHNAQRVARERDRRERERADAERDERQAFDLHLSSAGETRDADQELPDKPPPMYERLWQGDAQTPDASEPQDSLEPQEPSESADSPEVAGQQDGKQAVELVTLSPAQQSESDLNPLHKYVPGNQPVGASKSCRLDIKA